MTSLVTLNEADSRFEIRSDDTLAGILIYRQRENLYAFNHTIVEPPFEGRGLGTELVAQSVAIAQEKGWNILPYCPFVHSWFLKHPEFVALVPETRRQQFNLENL